MKMLISTKGIIKEFRIPYSRINYLTKKGVFKIVKRSGTKRLYNLEQIDTAVNREKKA